MIRKVLLALLLLSPGLAAPPARAEFVGVPAPEETGTVAQSDTVALPEAGARAGTGFR